MATRDESPLKCETCTERDKEIRNCSNHRELTEAALAVTDYTEEINAELREKKADRVFSLGDIRLYECPLTYIEAETWEVIRLVYLIEDTKILLHGGGWGNQPAWLVEAYTVFKNESATELRKARDVHKC